MANTDWPITQVIVVTESNRCPAGFTLIDRTYDKKEEADLWQDGLFRRKVCRYLCVERSAPAGKDVLVDLTVLNERDAIPAGFTCVDFTSDTREKALKKKMFCVRYMSSSLTQDAISELVLLSKGLRRPPNGYTLVGELNGMALCYKMSKFRAEETQNQQLQGHSSPMFHTQGYPTSPGHMNMSNMASSLPYAPSPMNRKIGPPERTESSLGMGVVTPLQGVPFQLNQRLIDNTSDISIPFIQYKTIMDIERQYEYTFTVERSAAARIP